MTHTLQKLKSQLGGRVSSVKVRDANAERQTQKARNIYSDRLVVALSAYKVQILANDELGCISIFGNFTLPRLTVNAEDRSGFKSVASGDVGIGSDQYPVFTEGGNITTLQRQALRSPALDQLITHHALRPGEALNIYRNCIVLYVRNADLSYELILLLVAFADVVPQGKGDFDDVQLPPGFSHLLRVCQEWACADDLERSEKITNASEEQLKAVLAVIKPELTSIDSYLQEFEGATPDWTTANLSRLIETSLEIEAALSRRHSRH